MNELKNLTNVVLEKLGKLVHKKKLYSRLFFYLINHNIIIVQVRYITIETKRSYPYWIQWFFPHAYHQGLHRSIHAEKETRYIQYTGRFFCFNSTVSFTW